MISQDDRAEFKATVPVHLWWRIDIDSASGCFRMVRGGRSGVEHRYPSDNRGRLVHRELWQAAHGRTDQLLVRVCGDPLCVRVSHVAPMDWQGAHSFHAQRRAQAPSGPATTTTAGDPPTTPTREPVSVTARNTTVEPIPADCNEIGQAGPVHHEEGGQ